VSRQLVRSLDRRRLRRLLGGARTRHTRCYLVVLPGCAKAALYVAERLAAASLEPVFVLNACGRSEALWLEQHATGRLSIRLTTAPGAPAKHGTVLTLLLESDQEPFAVVDHDCAIFESAVLADLELSEREFLLALDHPHFYTVNRRTGMRFPRTHFLLLNAPLLRALMSKYRVSAEKCRRPPGRAAARLRDLDLGPHNYPREYLDFYDTLLVLMSLALADGFGIRWRPAELTQIVHLPHLGLGHDRRARQHALRRSSEPGSSSGNRSQE
jgi:hypothetical protein